MIRRVTWRELQGDMFLTLSTGVKRYDCDKMLVEARRMLDSVMREAYLNKPIRVGIKKKPCQHL